MAKTAMVPMAARTAASIVTMNQAALLAACGEGWVMPMVLMKAFEIMRRSFICLRQERLIDGSRSGG